MWCPMTWKFELQEMDGLNWLDLDLTNSWLFAPILTNIQGIHPTKKCKIHIKKFDPYNFRCLNRLDSKSRCFYAYSHICRHMYILHISIYTDIIYKTPAQRFMLHNSSLHSWCLKKSQVAAAELLRDSVQWLGPKCKERSPVVCL